MFLLRKIIEVEINYELPNSDAGFQIFAWVMKNAHMDSSNTIEIRNKRIFHDFSIG